MNQAEHPKFAFFQGKIQPIENAKVDIRTNALQYGTAVFEGIRSYYNESEGQNYVFRLREHYARLFESAKIMMIDIRYSIDELCESTLELLRKEDYREDAYIRPFAYNSGLSIGPKLIGNEQDLFIYSIPLGDYLDTAKGIKVCTSSWTRIPDNCIPPRAKIAGSYVNAALQKTEAILSGYDEAVVLTMDGQHVSEGSAMNLFLIKNQVLITPEINNDILEGITRDSVLTIAKEELGLQTCIRSVDRTELYTADELFYSGTGAQIAPIGSVDHRTVGDGRIGPVTKKIQDFYFDIVKNKIEKYAYWCTRV